MTPDITPQLVSVISPTAPLAGLVGDETSTSLTG
jgi:hypothetical protein